MSLALAKLELDMHDSELTLPRASFARVRAFLAILLRLHRVLESDAKDLGKDPSPRD